MSHSAIFRSTFALMLCFSAGLAGCSSTALKPASSDQAVADMDRAARTSVDGVSVLVQDAAWPGDAAISQELTPLRVSIRNNADAPLRIAYEQFTLVDPQGRTSAALPLYEIAGTVEQPQLANRSAVVSEPRFLHTNFAVAPYLADAYPNVRSTALPFHYDEYYYGNHFQIWPRTSLPTPEMRMNALPEGVLESDGQVDGWLYFGKLGDAERVVFRADLSNAETGSGIGEVRVPFNVE